MGGWDTVRVLPPVSSDDLAEADAYVLARSDMELAAIDQVMSGRVQSAPILVTGFRAGHPDADAWLPDSAPASLVVAVVSQLIARARGTEGPSRPGVTWRRKTDMIVGHSLATRRLLHELDQLAVSSEPVTLSGEVGSGRALAARALHYCGPRAAHGLVSVRCSIVSEWSLEEDLASEGTLVLDEVGDLTPPLQERLLRALEGAREDGAIEAAPPPRRTAARLVATTSRDLAEDVLTGGFLEGLAALLARCTIKVAPLRERPEDIASIVRHHLGLLAQAEGAAAPRLTAGALEQLRSYGWPGNVRELVDTIERAFLMAEDGLIDAFHVVPGGAPISTERLKAALPTFRDAKSSFEHAYYSQLMRVTGGNVTLAAKLAMKTRKEIYDALKRLGLNATAYRGPLTAEGG
jgi:two-component system response regulator GlrR